MLNADVATQGPGKGISLVGPGGRGENERGVGSVFAGPYHSRAD